MALTPVFIIICVAFTLWLLLLLVIVSRLSALGSRVKRLSDLLTEFDNLDKNTRAEEQKLRDSIRQAGAADAK